MRPKPTKGVQRAKPAGLRSTNHNHTVAAFFQPPAAAPFGVQTRPRTLRPLRGGQRPVGQPPVDCPASKVSGAEAPQGSFATTTQLRPACLAS